MCGVCPAIFPSLLSRHADGPSSDNVDLKDGRAYSYFPVLFVCSQEYCFIGSSYHCLLGLWF